LLLHETCLLQMKSIHHCGVGYYCKTLVLFCTLSFVDGKLFSRNEVTMFFCFFWGGGLEGSSPHGVVSFWSLFIFDIAKVNSLRASPLALSMWPCTGNLGWDIVVSHLFAVPVSVLWVTIYHMDEYEFHDMKFTIPSLNSIRWMMKGTWVKLDSSMKNAIEVPILSQ
jgi:hypothetical protein